MREFLRWLIILGAVSCVLYDLVHLYRLWKKRKEGPHETDRTGQEGHGDDL